MKKRSKKGFTLAELLIVVAIIAVLVAISIPIFTGQLEKARRAVDMQNARIIKTILTNAYNEGKIEIPKERVGYSGDRGAWVLICRDEKSLPALYKSSKFHGNVFCGADRGVIVSGQKQESGADGYGWRDNYMQGVDAFLKEAGMDPYGLSIKCKNSSTGWDWIIIEVGYTENTDSFFSRIYSGKAGASGGLSQNANGTTNIEKMINGTK